MRQISLLEMLKSGVHFGHQTSKWHPKMKPYLFTSRNGIYIIDLVKTREKLNEAWTFVHDTVANGGTVLFVGTKRQSRNIVRQRAEEADLPYVVARWIGGLFTNFASVSRLSNKLKRLKSQMETGELQKYTKKERVVFQKEIEKLQEVAGGIEQLEKMPDAVFVVSARHDATTIIEAQKVGIPIIAIVDSNANPTNVAYPIPANDDALKSIDLVAGAIAEAAIEGRAEAGKRAEEKKADEEKEAARVAAAALAVPEKQ